MQSIMTRLFYFVVSLQGNSIKKYLDPNILFQFAKIGHVGETEDFQGPGSLYLTLEAYLYVLVTYRQFDFLPAVFCVGLSYW